jgi:hypothetical protein
MPQTTKAEFDAAVLRLWRALERQRYDTAPLSIRPGSKAQGNPFLLERSFDHGGKETRPACANGGFLGYTRGEAHATLVAMATALEMLPEPEVPKPTVNGVGTVPSAMAEPGDLVVFNGVPERVQHVRYDLTADGYIWKSLYAEPRGNQRVQPRRQVGHRDGSVYNGAEVRGPINFRAQAERLRDRDRVIVGWPEPRT